VGAAIVLLPPPIVKFMQRRFTFDEVSFRDPVNLGEPSGVVPQVLRPARRSHPRPSLLKVATIVDRGLLGLVAGRTKAKGRGRRIRCERRVQALPLGRTQ
jgi:hypothetical protein